VRTTGLVTAAALVALGAGAPATAQAPATTVEARPDNTFAPADVRVRAGEEVEWRNRGGFHNVAFDDGSFTEPPVPQPTAWTVRRRFDRPGTFAYVCRAHREQGMRGTVTVVAPEEPPPPPPPPPETAPDAAPRPPRLSGVRAGVRRCRPGRRCVRTIVVRFTLDRAAPVEVRVRRVAGGRARTLRRAASAGRNVVRVARVRRGRHRVVVAVDGGPRAERTVRVR
jgi:plastocyanin